MTAPNVNSHKLAITEALKDAGLTLDQLQAIEVHGTGMPLGDESELSALEQVHNEGADNLKRRYIIGAAKSMLGHLEAASGVMAFLKTLISLRDKKVHGIKGLTKIHTKYNTQLFSIDNEDQLLQQENKDPILMGLHGYGIGGVSAFLILKRYNNERTYKVKGKIKKQFVLSARTEFSLKKYAENICAFLEKQEDISSNSFDHFLVSYQKQREVLDKRILIEVESKEDLVKKL